MSFHHLRNLGTHVSIPIPKDEAGMLGRECPQPDCEGYFKIKPGTGLRGPDLPCHCPYCGHTGPQDHFWTKEQIEYAKSVALRKITDAVRADLKSLEFEHKPSGPFGIGVSMRLQPGLPIRLRHYREKALETNLTCGACTLAYAIFGVFGFCPDCRMHNSRQILRANLDLARKEVGLAQSQQDTALAKHLLEDALENCVSAFDGFARETCRIRASKSIDAYQAASLSFQNLPRVNARLARLFGVSLQGTVSASAWTQTHIAFMRRHLIAHKAGVIDQQYLDETGEPATLLGRRVSVAAKDVHDLSDAVSALGEGLLAILAGP